jgi:hypothetical protein
MLLPSSRSKERKKKSTEADGRLGYTSFFLGSFFDPEDGGDIFLRNVGTSELLGVTTQNIILFSCKFTVIFLI